MRQNAVIILGESSFMDFASLRQNLIRIPEVIDVVQQAQVHWDSLLGVKSLVLSNSFYRPDEFFHIHPEFKNLLNDLVQYGLFIRLQNQNNFEIKNILSNVNATRVHMLVLKLQNLKEFVLKHPAVRSFNKEPKTLRSLHSVHAQSKYSLFRPTSCGIKTIKTSSELIEIFHEIESADEKFVVLNLGIGQKLEMLKLRLNILDSISLDERLHAVFYDTGFSYFENSEVLA